MSCVVRSSASWTTATGFPYASWSENTSTCVKGRTMPTCGGLNLSDGFAAPPGPRLRNLAALRRLDLRQLIKPVDLLVECVKHGPELHLRHLGKHPDVLDVLRRCFLAVDLAVDDTLRGGRCAGDCTLGSLVGLLDDVALLGARGKQQVARGFHGLVDQGVSELLSLIEQGDGVVGDLFLRL